MQSNEPKNTNILEANLLCKKYDENNASNMPRNPGLNSTNPEAELKSENKCEINKNKKTNNESNKKIPIIDEYPNQDMFIEVSPKGRFGKFPEIIRKGPYKNEYKGVDLHTGKEIQWNDIFVLNLPIEDRKRFRMEMQFLKEISHENIQSCISYWFNEKQKTVVIITEFVSTNILQFIKLIRLQLLAIKKWCIQILKALDYLHNHKPNAIIHRHLKTENIFINSENSMIKIGDLSLSTTENSASSKSLVGTLEYIAPERFSGICTTKSDIYSFGICLLEIITKKKPYNEYKKEGEIGMKVIQGIYPKSLDEIFDQKIKSIILECLNSNCEQRPTARQLLDSPFFQDLDSIANKYEVILSKNLKFSMKSKEYSTWKDKMFNTIKAKASEYFNDSPNANINQDPSNNFLSGFNRVSEFRHNSIYTPTFDNYQSNIKGRFELLENIPNFRSEKFKKQRRLLSKSSDFVIHSHKQKVDSHDIKEIKPNRIVKISVIIEADDHEKLVSFEYDLDKDTYTKISQEMVQNCLLSSEQAPIIEKYLKNYIETLQNKSNEEYLSTNSLIIPLNKFLTQPKINRIYKEIKSSISNFDSINFEKETNSKKQIFDIVLQFRKLIQSFGIYFEGK